ncbi:MAG: hypothetical protein ACLSG9_03730 [Eubacterium sp.]
MKNGGNYGAVSFVIEGIAGADFRGQGETQKKIRMHFRIRGKIVRRRMDHDKANLWRPAFVRDVEKIMHVPYYSRYSDKTQVFSFYQNDDISKACPARSARVTHRKKYRQCVKARSMKV